MAVLTGLNIDPNVKENSGDFRIIDAGWYDVIIVDDDLKPTADTKDLTPDKQNLVWHLTMQIRSGHFLNEEIKDFINIKNDKTDERGNRWVEAKGQGRLRFICGLTNCQFPPTDTRKMYGKPFQILIGIDDSGDRPRNRIKKYAKIEKTMPKIASTPVPATNQQSAESDPDADPNGGW